MHKWYVNMQQSKCSTSYERHNNKLWTTLPIWHMLYNNQPGWMISEWYNKQMARYEQCIGINLNRENQNYTTINGRSISIGIFPIWYMSIQQSTRMDDTWMIQQTNGTIWTMYRDESESAKSKLYNNQCSWQSHLSSGNAKQQYTIRFNVYLRDEWWCFRCCWICRLHIPTKLRIDRDIK